MTQTLEPGTFVGDWTAWQAERERQRREPHGFLAYRDVHFLTAEPQAFTGVPGRWTTGQEGPAVELGPGETLTVDGHEIGGRHVFGPVAEREFRRAATLRDGDVVLELSKRGGRDLLRPLDPANGLRADYIETPAYAPDPAWVIEAELERHPAARPQRIRAAVEGIEHVHDALGEIVFRHEGAEHRLVVLAYDRADDRADELGIVLFRDATSGVTTYGASRSLLVTLPAAGERRLVLDLNRAQNLQCAYTDHAPCPLAPASNHLPFAVEAGERIPTFHSGREATR
ncbi:DUF1684 domain-containing protein [Pseudonocardia ailaonensis]|uniref:DUF1684 domain-containing protein n=1 Tax=Pseudonocardia ailaonensis TaxID=367279 RepID=A0ABN2MRQ9_9PSEU